LATVIQRWPRLALELPSRTLAKGQIAVCDDFARDIAATFVGVRLVEPETITN
jgi:hypothetical protein